MDPLIMSSLFRLPDDVGWPCFTAATLRDVLIVCPRHTPGAVLLTTVVNLLSELPPEIHDITYAPSPTYCLVAPAITKCWDQRVAFATDARGVLGHVEIVQERDTVKFHVMGKSQNCISSRTLLCLDYADYSPASLEARRAAAMTASPVLNVVRP